MSQKWLVILGFIAGLLLQPQKVFAGSWGGGGVPSNNYIFDENNGTVATYLLRNDVCLPKGVLVEFHTGNLSHSWADPQMHILRSNGTTYEEVYYDDDSLDGTNPSISFFNNIQDPPSGCTNFRILVRAFDNDSGGAGGATFTLFMGTSTMGTYRLGGYQPLIATRVGETRSLETIRVNEGASAAMIYRFEKAPDGHYKYVAYDSSSGVGPFTARLSGSAYSGVSASNVQWVIATPYTNTREGPVRVLMNDVREQDNDGDGLGTLLESELCTCDTPSGYACGWDCSLGDPKDTDGDGISDFYEAIGDDDEFNPLELYRWGASPTHKDIFVEVDRQAYNDPDKFTDSVSEDVLTMAASRYSGLENVPNPDGVPGIDLHFDVDHPCEQEEGLLDGVAGDSDGFTKLCGDHGGASMIAVGQTGSMESIGAANLLRNRRNTFHWLHLYDGDQGYATLDCWVAAVGMQPKATDVASNIAHELGHNLRLTHQGALDGSGFNHNPIYASLMNYAYSKKMEGSANNIAFSQGSRDCLSPLQLSETTVYSPGANIDFLSSEPMRFPTLNGQVDWNRDGHYDPYVQGLLLAPGGHGFGGEDIPPAQGMNEVSGSITLVGAGVAPFRTNNDDAIWLVQNNPQNGTFQFRVRYDSSSPEWTNWGLLGGISFRPSSEPAVTEYTSTKGRHLYVLGVEDTSAGIISGYEINGGGQRTAMQFSFPPTGVDFASVSVAATSEHLYVVGRNDDSSVWINRMHYVGSTQVWSGWYQVSRATSAGSSPAEAIGEPAIVAGPDDNLYMVYKFIDTTHRIITYDTAEPLSTLWSDVIPGQTGKSLWGTRATDCHPGTGRPGLVYAPHKGLGDSLLPRGTGALWLWYRAACEEGLGSTKTFFRRSYGHFDSDGPGADFSMGDYYYTPISSSVCIPQMPDVGVALVAGSRGVEAFLTQETDGTCSGESLIHLPYADGYSNVEVCDSPDPAVMQAHLASSVEFRMSCPAPSFSDGCNAP